MKITGCGHAIYMISPPTISDSSTYLRTLNRVEHWESIPWRQVSTQYAYISKRGP